MPTYIRPARVDITEDSDELGSLVLLAAAVVAVAAVVAFIAAHVILLAVCAGVFAAVMAGLAVWFRWAASPKRLRQQQQPRVPARVATAAPARALSAPRPRAIERPAVHLHFHGVSAQEMAAIIRRELP